MEYVTEPIGFFVGLFLVILFFWNAAMGEIALRTGAVRFDERPWTWAFVNSFFLTFGFLMCTCCMKAIPCFQWLVSFRKALTAQSEYHVLGVTFVLCAMFAYALEKYVVRANQ